MKYCSIGGSQCFVWQIHFAINTLNNNNNNDQQNKQAFIIYNNIDNIAYFIRFSSHLVIPDLKYLTMSDLSATNLSNADLLNIITCAKVQAMILSNQVGEVKRRR